MLPQLDCIVGLQWERIYLVLQGLDVPGWVVSWGRTSPSQRGKGGGMVGEVMSVVGVYLGGEEGGREGGESWKCGPEVIELSAGINRHWLQLSYHPSLA